MAGGGGGGSGSGSGGAGSTITTGSFGGGLTGNGSGGGVYVYGTMPAGLSDVSMLSTPSYLTSSIPYTETHNVTRSENNSVTINQSGTGSSGTFTVTVSGSNKFSDTASGSGGSGTETETSSGSSSGSNTYQVTYNGTYANGLFTVTSQSGSESGNTSEKGTYTTTNPSSTIASQEEDYTRSTNSNVSWSGSFSGGEWTYSSYSETDTTTVSDHTHTLNTDGSYNDYSYTTTEPLTANASTYSANDSLSNSWTVYYSAGSPANNSGSTNSNKLISGTTDLSSLTPDTSGWQWFAGASNATGYTFTGGMNESASLTETAVAQATTGGPSLSVSSFSSNFSSSQSANTVDDEPQTPASPGGTSTFHRNETYGGGVTVTGSGAYGVNAGAGTNATYKLVLTGTVNVGGDNTSDTNETATGTYADGTPYTEQYNWGGKMTGNGTYGLTQNYQDLGSGLALTSETCAAPSGSAESNDTLTGNVNGQPFNMSATVPETLSGSDITLSGSTTPIGSAGGLVGCFPLWDTVFPNGATYTAPNKYPGGFLQSGAAGPAMKFGYSTLAKIAAKYADKASARGSAIRYLRQGMVQTADQGGTQYASGQFTTAGGGRTWAEALREGKRLAFEQEKALAFQKTRPGWATATEGDVDIKWTYNVQGGAGTGPRSGKVVIQYQYMQHITNAAGQETTAPLVGGVIEVTDQNLINRRLK